MPTPASPQTMPLEAVAVPRPTVLTETNLRQMYVALLECQLLADCDRDNRSDAGAGMEAILAGCTAAMEPTDKTVLPRWIAAAGHLRGVPLTDSVAQIMTHKSVETSKNGFPSKRSIKDADASLMLALTVGLAWNEQMEPNRRAVVAFTQVSPESRNGDAAALNFAFTRKLPIVFVNKLGRPTHRKNGTAQPQIFARSGIPCMAVDGDDAVAIFRVASESMRRAHDGGGPSWIDCHFGPWGHALQRKSSYRNPAEQDAWQSHSPLEQMERLLTKKGLFSAEWAEKIRGDFQAQLLKAKRHTPKTVPPESLGREHGIFCFSTTGANPIARNGIKR